ncbi:MAG: right-handed parallel beta-helix repeat-containing protein, partial [Bacteroidota bacterium]
MRSTVLLIFSVLLAFTPLFSANYPVINTLDAGPGSLRDAITLANARLGKDTISFNIPTVGVKTITLQSNLPAISDSLLIDGSTDSGYSGQPLIEINGDNVVNDIFELLPTAANSEITALILNRSRRLGIVVRADNFRLRSSYIGTDPSGTIAQPNGSAISIQAGKGSIIGGDGANEGNLISGNSSVAIILGLAASKVSIQGNLIGTDITGSFAIPNFMGLDSDCDSLLLGGNSLLSRNIISGNTNGAYLDGSHYRVYNNYIGTDISGTFAIPNTGLGLFVRGDSAVIGGSTALERNIISGNIGGILVANPTAIGTKIIGNYFGTDHTGTLAIGNAQFGLSLNACTEVTVGGINPGEGNLISANQKDGLVLNSGNTIYILGNRIGTDISGTLVLGNDESGITLNSPVNVYIGDGTVAGANVISANQWHGINFSGSADTVNIKYNYIGTDPSTLLNLGNGIYGIAINGGSQAEIGGTLPNEGNFIANNASGGIHIYYFRSIQNQILGNSIYDNAGPGIRLTSGSNNYQTAPELTGYNQLPGSTTFFGNFTSLPNTNFRLEFFSSPTSEQGKTYLGATFITTDATGFYALAELLPITINATEPIVTATATDPDGNTSEFGVEVVLNPEILDFRMAEDEQETKVLFWELEESEEELLFEIEQKKGDNQFKRIGTLVDFKMEEGKKYYSYNLGFLSAGSYSFRLKM